MSPSWTTEGCLAIRQKPAVLRNLGFSVAQRSPSSQLASLYSNLILLPIIRTSCPPPALLCISLLYLLLSDALSPLVDSPGHAQSIPPSLCYGLFQMPLDIFSLLFTLKTFPQMDRSYWPFLHCGPDALQFLFLVHFPSFFLMGILYKFYLINYLRPPLKDKQKAAFLLHLCSERGWC